ncbi:hypothetical protein COT03_00290 [Candidatus Shapirobacteria bacterium CG07_land_8_20_14_0_80_39_18]|uniref:RNHCP domain-containing protein n=1 Tax=Candidatus Shapirobacteria bacterium CG07_land_8_20_14_0_80_39_18 TaxID=1974882 RepID=A0A2M6YS97_9BACT|nr:MAG: hypothetical protein COT03_00290 [Candidatus Shapirobacteria bacterium CG07_land_8_20_14_0_80_39_18]
MHKNGDEKHFIRKKEDFICQVCGTYVKGNGYTNHCPNCLWSKDVDLEVPGDRACACNGLMEPLLIELKKGKYFLLHRCQKCGKLSKNRTCPEDNFEKIVELSSNHI